jgi:hypothetical protein
MGITAPEPFRAGSPPTGEPRPQLSQPTWRSSTERQAPAVARNADCAPPPGLSS